MAKKKSGLLIVFVVACSLCTCGIEDYPIIDPILQASIYPVSNSYATIRVPRNYDSTYFSHFEVYYRIFTSDVLVASTVSSDSYAAINAALASSYNSFYPYIDSTTHVNLDMDRIFRGRGFRPLSVDGTSINSVLSSSIFGNDVVFDFSSGRSPRMIAKESTYILTRSNDGGLFDLRPDRLFINNENLYNPDNISTTSNADVEKKEGITAGARCYTYAAMFITAVGINVSTYNNIYSTPSLIHVFLLPD